jgi:hypothetical protein
MEDAVEGEKDPKSITLRVLVVNFAAIHSTSTVNGFFLPFIRLVLTFP